MSTWLITGGAGFIGNSFVRLAHQHTQCKIIILDALTYAGDVSRLGTLLDDDRVQFVKGDICDAQLINNLFASCNISKVIHFAAESHVDRSILGPAAFVKTNIEGTYTMLEAARKAWTDTSGKLFLHVSTDEVYGSLGQNDLPFNETTPYRPSSPYSSSKASSDLLVRAWHHTYGLPAIITNCSNNYGPWQFPEKLIPLMIMNAYEGKDLPIYGDGTQIRDWLHVDDHCRAILTVMEKGRIGDTYCIGGNCERTNISIVQQICDIVDRAVNREEGYSRQLIKQVKDRPGHDWRYAIDSSKLMKELGWKPLYALDNALPELVQWYISNMAWMYSIRSGDYQKTNETQFSINK